MSTRQFVFVAALIAIWTGLAYGAGPSRNLLPLIERACEDTQDLAEAYAQAKEAIGKCSFEECLSLWKDLMRKRAERGRAIAEQVAWQVCIDFLGDEEAKKAIPQHFDAIFETISDRQELADVRRGMIRYVTTHLKGFHDTSYLKREQALKLTRFLRSVIQDTNEEELFRRRAVLDLWILSKNQLVLALRRNPATRVQLQERVPIVEIVAKMRGEQKDAVEPFVREIEKDVACMLEIAQQDDTSAELSGAIASGLQRYSKALEIDPEKIGAIYIKIVLQQELALRGDLSAIARNLKALGQLVPDEEMTAKLRESIVRLLDRHERLVQEEKENIQEAVGEKGGRNEAKEESQ